MTANIASFPVELLTEIFSSGQIHDFMFADYEPIEGNAQLAMAVSQVCRHWRGAALGFAPFWVYVSWKEGRPMRYLPQVAMQIQRSCNRPLAIFLSLPAHEHGRMTVRAVLGKDLFQAKHISITKSDKETLVSILGATTPNLCSLSISTPFSSRIRFAALLNNFEALRCLRLSGVDLTSSSVRICRLNVLAVDVAEFPLYPIVAPSSSTLTSLTIGATALFNPLPSRPIPLPFLQELVFCGASNPRSWLSVPCLTVLRFRHEIKGFGHCVSNILAAWTTDPLVTLELFAFELLGAGYHPPRKQWDEVKSALQWPNLFGALPNVSSVEWDIKDMNEIVEVWGAELSAGENGTVNWPLLRSIKVVEADLDDDGRAAVLAAIPEGRIGALDVVFV